jgi:hypothetical protein
MYAEITQEVFNSISEQVTPEKTEQGPGGYSRQYFSGKGVTLIRVTNSQSSKAITQYYIQDINS